MSFDIKNKPASDFVARLELPPTEKRPAVATERSKVESLAVDGFDPDANLLALAPVTAPPTAPTTPVKPLPFLGTGVTSFDPIGNIIRDVTPLSPNKTMFGLDGWTLQLPHVLTGETRWHPSMKAEAVLKAGLEALAPPPELGSWNIGQNIERKSEHDQRLNDLYDQLAEAWTRDEKKSFRNDAGEVFDQWGQEDFKAEAFDLLRTHAGRDFMVDQSFKTLESRGGDEAQRLAEARRRFGDKQVGDWLVTNRGVEGFDQLLQEKLAAKVENPQGTVTGSEAAKLETQAVEQAQKEARAAYAEYQRRRKNSLTPEGERLAAEIRDGLSSTRAQEMFDRLLADPSSDLSGSGPQASMSGAASVPLKQAMTMAKERDPSREPEQQLAYEKVVQRLITRRLRSGKTTGEEEQALGMLLDQSKRVVSWLKTFGDDARSNEFSGEVQKAAYSSPFSSSQAYELSARIAEAEAKVTTEINRLKLNTQISPEYDHADVLAASDLHAQRNLLQRQHAYLTNLIKGKLN